MLTNRDGGLVAIHNWHGDIHQHDVKLTFLNRLDRFAAIVHDGDVVTSAAEYAGGHLLICRCVLDNQYRQADRSPFQQTHAGSLPVLGGSRPKCTGHRVQQSARGNRLFQLRPSGPFRTGGDIAARLVHEDYGGRLGHCIGDAANERGLIRGGHGGIGDHQTIGSSFSLRSIELTQCMIPSMALSGCIDHRLSIFTNRRRPTALSSTTRTGRPASARAHCGVIESPNFSV